MAQHTPAPMVVPGLPLVSLLGFLLPVIIVGGLALAGLLIAYGFLFPTAVIGGVVVVVLLIALTLD
jgi:hypothetical protein